MLLAGTTFTELDQAASFWFALMGTWRGEAPPHLRPHTCSRQLCELPPVTAPASTGPADLPSLLARRRMRHPDLSRPEAARAGLPRKTRVRHGCLRANDVRGFLDHLRQ